MDKGMKKVVNLVTKYMSALCETGRARVLNEYFL